MIAGSPPKRPLVDVVVVSYRCHDLLRDCLRSITETSSALLASLHVIDNGSNDGTVEMLHREFPHVRVTESELNLGFARATNIGLRAGGAPYALALNPDTVTRSGALEHLLNVMERRPDVGIASCRLELPDGTTDHAAARSFPTILGAVGHFTGCARRSGGGLGQYRAVPEHAGPVDMVSGAFMLLRRAALDDVGLFDERYWMYIEDIDLCYRFAQAGWTTWYDPSVSVTHRKGGTSLAGRAPRVVYSFHYGMYRFYRTHYARRQPFYVNSAVYAGIAGKLVFALAQTTLRRRFLHSG